MENKKSVDENWKGSVESEQAAAKNDSGEHYKVTFFNYISSLGFQTMVFLGEIDNPITGKNEKNLQQAKFLIDTLSMIKEKTSGNLSKEEDNLLTSSLYELQLKYVAVQQREA